VAKAECAIAYYEGWQRERERESKREKTTCETVYRWSGVHVKEMGEKNATSWHGTLHRESCSVTLGTRCAYLYFRQALYCNHHCLFREHHKNWVVMPTRREKRYSFSNRNISIDPILSIRELLKVCFSQMSLGNTEIGDFWNRRFWTPHGLPYSEWFKPIIWLVVENRAVPVVVRSRWWWRPGRPLTVCRVCIYLVFNLLDSRPSM
jgi:hypothetical protein